MSEYDEDSQRSWGSSPTLQAQSPPPPRSSISSIDKSYRDDIEEYAKEDNSLYHQQEKPRWSSSRHRFALSRRRCLVVILGFAILIILWTFSISSSYSAGGEFNNASEDESSLTKLKARFGGKHNQKVEKLPNTHTEGISRVKDDSKQKKTTNWNAQSVSSPEVRPSAPSNTSAPSFFSTQSLEDFARYFKDIRLDNPDGLAFAQMGFRTRMYAHLLDEELQRQKRNDASGTANFEELERGMWFFLPGIESIRKRSQNRQANGKPSRGIVLSVDTSRFTYTCHFLSMLRNHYKSDLPVEIFYFGDSDLPKSMRDHLTHQYKAKTINLEKEDFFEREFTKLGGYAIKPFALLATSFSEVMMADADAVLLANPDEFFNQKGYKETGTLFFQDRKADHKSEGGHDFVVQQMGSRNVSHHLSQTPFWKEQLKHYQESGVVVVDRSRPEVFSALLFAAWQNGKLMRETVLDRHFWGDKESFWMSFELSGFPYYMVNHSCGAIGREHVEYAEANQGFCSEHPLHFFDNQDPNDGVPDPNDSTKRLGRPAWFNGSLRLNKYNGEPKLLDPTDDTIWVMNGTWTFYGHQLRWCLTDYKRFGIHEYDMGLTLGKLGRASRDGEELTKAVMG